MHGAGFLPPGSPTRSALTAAAAVLSTGLGGPTATTVTAKETGPSRPLTPQHLGGFPVILEEASGFIMNVDEGEGLQVRAAVVAGSVNA